MSFYFPLITRLNILEKCTSTSSLLSINHFLKNDLGAMCAVPNSKNFPYSASHCFVPMINSNSPTCWKSMDLLRSPVTRILRSFGGLAGSRGVISMILSCNKRTLSSKASRIARLSNSVSIFISAMDYTIISTKSNKWSSFPPKPGVLVTNRTS